MEKEVIRVFERNIKLNGEQERELTRRINQAGFIYNIMLERCREFGPSPANRESLASKDFYETKISMKFFKDPSSVPDYIIDPVTYECYFKALPRDVVLDVAMRCADAHNGWVTKYFKFYESENNGSAKEPGMPRFKNPENFSNIKYWFTKSEKVTQNYELDIVNKTIILHSIPGIIKISNLKGLRNYTAIKGIMILRRSGKWRIKIYFNQLMNEKPKTGLVAGGDLGVNKFLTLDCNGFFYPNIVSSRDTKDLARVDRKISKLREENPETYKSLPKYAKLLKVRNNIYSRVSNKNKNTYLHWADQLVNTFDTLVLEDLNKLEMFKTASSFLRSKLHKVSWKQFIKILTYKAAYAGKEVLFINPAYTSQTCSRCHARLTKPLKKYDTFVCEVCGFTADRDVNAAKVILLVGLDILVLVKS